MNSRFVLVAFDAADIALIQRWSEDSSMPAFAKVCARSRTIPTLNDPGLYVGSVWPTLFTGTSPAWHGRYCWRQLRAGTYEDEFFQIDQIRGDPLWDRLDRAGRSVCVIDVPKSAPGTHFRGRFVKDWGTHDPSMGGCRIYNWMTREEFLVRYGRDEVGRCDAVLRTERGFRDFCAKLLARVEARTRMVCDVLSERSHDVVLVAFSEAHCVGHQCWHIHDPNHEQHDVQLRRQLGDPVRAVYEALDRGLGCILDHVRELDTVLVLATHGMGPHYNGVESLNAIVANLEHDDLPRHDQRELLARGVPALLSHDSRDFRRRMRAFPVPNNGAYAAFRANVAGREPAGRLTPDSVERFLRGFRDRLMDVKNADTGERLFASATLSLEAFSGPRRGCLPDLLLEWDRSAPIRRVTTPRSVLQNHAGGNPRTGDHRAHGAMWVLGPGANVFEAVSKIRAADLASWIVRAATQPLEGPHTGVSGCEGPCA